MAETTVEEIGGETGDISAREREVSTELFQASGLLLGIWAAFFFPSDFL